MNVCEPMSKGQRNLHKKGQKNYVKKYYKKYVRQRQIGKNEIDKHTEAI